ncbi:thioredoxin domain-containing protein [Nocardia speluncae]|uniref:Thioredoxin domain-containing protein n=1 Tax=Nocardia speluncae TaxID=419477 RepID=A0A846X8L5_9NOCA|nr:thioredoxin domain-containing protein [Nocardia speluncae]
MRDSRYATARHPPGHGTRHTRRPDTSHPARVLLSRGSTTRPVRSQTISTQDTTTRSLPWKAIAIGAIVVALLAVGAAISASTGGDPSRAAPSTAEESNGLPDLARRDDNDPFAIGAVDAPVVVIEYADFTCPYCGAFAAETLPALLDEYVEPGHVRIEWRDTPILTDHSVETAIAGRAAAEQDLFWEFSREMFAHTYSGSKDYRRETLIGIADKVKGLDTAAFTAALDDPGLAAAVDREADESRNLGVSGTPTFIVGDQILQGAQPVDAFRQVIDAQLEGIG